VAIVAREVPLYEKSKPILSSLGEKS